MAKGRAEKPKENCMRQGATTLAGGTQGSPELRATPKKQNQDLSCKRKRKGDEMQALPGTQGETRAGSVLPAPLPSGACGGSCARPGTEAPEREGPAAQPSH